MFTVDEATAAAIRTAFDKGGELSAVLELRRHFRLIADNEQARACVRTIVEAAATQAAEGPPGGAAPRWLTM